VRPRRRIVTGGRVVTAAAGALLAASCLLPPRHAPRLVPVPPPAPAFAATVPEPTAPLLPADGPGCVAEADAQRDPFSPICPPPALP
jgi:hypothetical protein